MFTSVLVPLDGSALAEHALDVALSIARTGDTQLHVVTVRATLPDRATQPDDAEQRYLQGIAHRIAARLGRPIVHALLADDDARKPSGQVPRRVVADVLADYVRTHNISLTVMTSHGRGGVARGYLGSVADVFVRHSPAPVLIVSRSQIRPPLQHILVLLDGTREAQTILGPTHDLARALGAKCTLLRVVADPSETYHAVRTLVNLCSLWESTGVHAQPEIRISDDSAGAILTYARTYGVDALALTTYTRHVIQRVPLGSIAEAMMREAGKPVLIFNPFAQELADPSTIVGQAVYG